MLYTTTSELLVISVLALIAGMGFAAIWWWVETLITKNRKDRGLK